MEMRRAEMVTMQNQNTAMLNAAMRQNGQILALLSQMIQKQ